MHKIYIELTDAQCLKLSKQKGNLDVNAYAKKLVLKGLRKKSTATTAARNALKAKLTRKKLINSKKFKEE